MAGAFRDIQPESRRIACENESLDRLYDDLVLEDLALRR